MVGPLGVGRTETALTVNAKDRANGLHRTIRLR